MHPTSVLLSGLYIISGSTSDPLVLGPVPPVSPPPPVNVVVPPTQSFFNPWFIQSVQPNFFNVSFLPIIGSNNTGYKWTIENGTLVANAEVPVGDAFEILPTVSGKFIIKIPHENKVLSLNSSNLPQLAFSPGEGKPSELFEFAFQSST